MKKIMSKILIIFLIILMLFEFLYSSNISYALEEPSVKTINEMTNLIGGIVSILLWKPRIIATAAMWTLGKIMTEGVAGACGTNFGSKGEIATPFDIFFGKYKLFDVNFFDITGEDTIIMNIRKSVAQWFYLMRTLSAAILLCVLIYVGIRMAISTVADEKAKYKKMLFDWICSLALIFVLQYLAIFIIYINNAIVDFLHKYDTESGNQMRTAIYQIMGQATLGMGITSIVSTLVYCMIIFQTIFFMITYIQRMLKVAFLLIISPLISLTYSIDKIGDGKAQALNIWLKEFIYTILIQPFHCIIYLAFVKIAIGLLVTPVTGFATIDTLLQTIDPNFNQLVNGVLAILCIKFISDGEKAIRKIFNFQDDGSLTSMAAGAAMGIAAVATLRKAKNAGTSIAKGVNSVKSFGSNMSKAFNKDKQNNIMGQLANTKLGKATAKLGNMGSKVGNKVKNSKVGRFTSSKVSNAKTRLSNAQNWVNNLSGVKKLKSGARYTMGTAKKALPYIKKGTGFAGKVAKKSLPSTLAMMGAAMTLATGSGGAMDAIGVGSALHDGTEGYFSASMSTTEKSMKEQAEKAIDEEFDQTDEGKKLKRLNDIPKELDKVNKNLNNIAKNAKNRPSNMSANEYLNNFINTRRQIETLKNSSSEEDRNKAINMENDLKSVYGKDYNALNSGLLQKEALEDERDDLLLEESSLQNSKKRFINNKRSNADDLITKLKNNGSEGQIEAAKSKMLQLIQVYMLDLKRKNAGQSNDSNVDYQLTDKEITTSQRICNSIAQSVDRAVKGSGADIDTRELIQKHNIEGDTDLSENLMSAINNYKFQQRAAEFNSARSNGSKFGASTDKLDNDVKKYISKSKD